MRLLGILLLVTPLLAQESGPARADWAHYGGTQSSWRYSALDQINTGNVKNLAPAWIFQTGDYAENLHSTPIVIDGVMYLISATAQVFALNAATGSIICRIISRRTSPGLAPRDIRMPISFVR